MRLQVFHDLKQIAPSESAVAMGVFDGVHLGHQRVISCVTFTARKLVPTVFTFDASPQEMFKGDGDLRLTAGESKLRLFERLGECAGCTCPALKRCVHCRRGSL